MVDDTPLQAAEALNLTRSLGLQNFVDCAIKGMRDLSDERLAHLKNYVQMRFDELTVWREQRTIFVEEMLKARDKDIGLQFASRDRALEIQAAEYARRLDILNHERERLHGIGETYVRNDIYAKDMERLYTERREQQSQAEAQRVAQDIAAETNRRATMLAMLSAAITVGTLIVTILMRLNPHQ